MTVVVKVVEVVVVVVVVFMFARTDEHEECRWRLE